MQALDVWSYIFSGNISTVPLWQTVTLPALRTAPPVRGSPWAPDRALCGRDWILRRISGIYRDKQSATVYFHVCGKKQQKKKTQFGCTAPHLLYTCLNPDGDREGQLGERKRQKPGVSTSAQQREWFYSALSRRRKKTCKKKKTVSYSS